MQVGWAHGGCLTGQGMTDVGWTAGQSLEACSGFTVDLGQVTLPSWA